MLAALGLDPGDSLPLNLGFTTADALLATSLQAITEGVNAVGHHAEITSKLKGTAIYGMDRNVYGLPDHSNAHSLQPSCACPGDHSGNYYQVCGKKTVAAPAAQEVDQLSQDAEHDESHAMATRSQRDPHLLH